MKECVNKISSLLISTLFVATIFATVTYAQSDENILDNSTINNSTINNLTINNSTLNNPTTTNSTLNNSIDDTNLLINANLTSESTLADYWVMEKNVSGNIKWVTTQNTQSICYRGQLGDDGTKKITMYQAPIKGVSAGSKIRFSMLVSGNITSSPTIIGIGAFNRYKKWLGESDIYISVSNTPKLYEVTYVCPQNTDYVAVYLQCQEIYQSTDIDISFQKVRLVIVPK